MGKATVNVSGARFDFYATLESGDELFVGGNCTAVGGTAVLNIGVDGRVVVPNRLRLYPTGNVNLDGGRLEVGSFDFQGGSILNFISGTVQINGDATLTPMLGYQLLGVGGTVSSCRMLSVADRLTIDAADRLVVSQGAIVGGSLANNGDLDVIVGSVTFATASTASGDINAIDSTLTFTVGLTSTGQINLINTTIDGSVMLSDTTALAGVNIFAADVAGAGSFTGGGLARFEAVYSPGASPALVTFDGSVEFAATSTLILELGRTTPGDDYDQFQAAGTLTLAGTLQIMLANEFAPSASDAFELIAANSVVGAFENVVVTSSTGSGTFDITYTPTGPKISEFFPSTFVRGDYNRDGEVEAADHVVWRSSLGQSGPGFEADGNGDETVDELDYNVWTSNFGAAAGSGNATATNLSVPELTAIVPVLLALITVAVVYRRKEGVSTA